MLLRGTGWSVTLLSTSNSLHRRVQDNLHEAGVHLRLLPLSRGEASNRQKTVWLARQILKLREQRWDVIYTNGQGGLVPLVWQAGHRDTRLIHHHHTSAAAEERAGWNLPFRLALQSAPTLVACSQATRHNLLAGLDRPGGNVIHLPYLYPWEPSPQTYAPPDGPPWRLIFAGRLTVSKGIDTILQLASAHDLQDVEWHLFGSGESYTAEDFADVRRVHYHGRYESRRELLEHFSRMHGMVLFSRHSEGLPVTLLEATELGLPWIASDRGGTREIALRSPDCQILPANFTTRQAHDAVLQLREALQCRTTDPAALREHFDARYAPARVRAAWLRLFGER
ncbi:MAG: group 1 glycosyl transferase [Puniceicoccaceae bacterium 5H]|nr:MAG: group 1 glycosyl transferase [Puniceicoccaceae bacterium 5H]